MAKFHPQRAVARQPKQTKSRASEAIAPKFQRAVAHHQCGQFALAEGLYCEILAEVPTHFDALHFLGGLQYQKGEYQAAAELIQKAINEKTNDATAHANLGLANHKLRNLEKALASYDRALVLKPDYAEVFNNRGTAL